MSGRTAAFFLAAATLLVVALSTGSAVYYMLFAAMMLMLGLGLFSVLVALFTARISVSCSARTVERGGKLAVSVRAGHFSLLPVKSMTLTLSVPERAGAVHTFDLNAPPITGRLYEYMLSCPHRGIFHIGVSRIEVTDLFQLFSLKRRIRGGAFDITVMPRTQEIPAMDLRSGDSGPEYLSRMTEDNASPADVRSWQEGDPLKKIHWKLSMRKRELMVRTYEESARPDTLILVDLSPIGALEAFSLSIEDAICETAATVALAQLQAMYPVRMPLQSARPVEITGQSPAEGMRFVEALAKVSFDAPYSYDQVLTLGFRRMQRTGGAVLVTSRLTARIADIALQMRRTGVQVCLCLVSDAVRAETDELISRLILAGVIVRKVNPWNEKLLKQES